MPEHADRPLTLAQAAKMFPRQTNGKKVAAAAVYRWTIHGHRGVRLEAVRTPRGLRTTVGAVCRFMAAVEASAIAATGPAVEVEALAGSGHGIPGNGVARTPRRGR